MSEQSWPEREKGVDGILKNCGIAKFINARPELLSLLYDIDMLPEQCVTRAGAIRLVAFCDVWRKGENHQLPPAPAE